MGGALAGVRVIELTNTIAGAYCGRLLAWFGADVIKVEAREGQDESRLPHLHPFLNASKQSVAIDHMSPSGKRALNSLLSAAPLFIEDGAYGGIEDRKLLAGELTRLDGPIYVAISPFGLSGPRSTWQATDAVALAASGWLHGTAREGEQPFIPGTDVASYGTGMVAALGALLALRARRGDGSGQLVDATMVESLLSFLAFPTVRFSYSGETAMRIGDSYPFGIFPCADGYMGVNILTQRHWEGLCELMDRVDLRDDPGLKTGADRANPESVQRISQAIHDWFADKPALETLSRGQAMGVPLASIPSPSELIDSPQYGDRAYWRTEASPTGAELRTPGPPFKGKAGTLVEPTVAPKPGADTQSILGAFRVPDSPGETGR